MAKTERRGLAHWYLNAFDLSRELSRKELAELRARGQTRRFRPGQVIHFAGDLTTSVCLVLSGLLELTRPHEEGRELVISLVRPGEVFGVLALLGRFPEPDTARARVASDVCFFSPEEFRRQLQAHPHMAFTVIKSLEGETVTLENRIEALVFKSLPARVAHTLLQIARAFGKRVDHGVRFTMSLTQQNLADLVGASRQHVNYVLADFRSHRLLSGSGRALTLTNLEGLRRIALAP
ncbi:MAG: Crp/Fnr family transcriptional regulator [candidate division NC10 bacterium]